MAKKRRHSFVSMIFAALFLVIISAVIIVMFTLYAKFGPTVIGLYKDAKEIADASKEEDFKAAETSLIYDSDENLLQALKGEKDVYYIKINNIPEYAKNAMICIEDKKYYIHNGVDIKANLRAAIELVRNNGIITQGGSTITQQLAKNIYLTQKQSYERKIEEIFLAMQLEKIYSKDQILEYYLNNIYFGNGCYGIQAAANGYFDKSVNSLSLSQIAFLCGIPNNPNKNDPYVNINATLERRNLILKQMCDDGMITEAEYTASVNEQIEVIKKKSEPKSSVETFVMDSAIEALMAEQGFDFQNTFTSESEKLAYDLSYDNLYSQCQQSLYTAGYRIYTSIDMKKQKLLQDNVDEALAAYEDVDEKTGIYKAQGAATCVDNATGRVVAIVGGRTQKLDGYTLNRAYQSYRQPGSSIKPVIVYTPAMETGYTPDSIVLDEPIKDEEHAPKNSDGSYSGKISLRSAVAASKNVVAWRIFEELTPEVGLSYLKKMHFNRIIDRYAQPNDYNISAAIGGFTYGTNTKEMASAYSAIENDGKWRNPTCIVRIMNTDGETIVGDDVKEEEVYQQNAARMMTSVMQTVIQSGTGAGLGFTNGTVKMPCAGKTGTTDDNKDGWFCGFSKYYTTTVWIGYDTPEKWSALYGGTFPGKVWHNFMEAIHEGLDPLEFDMYENVKSTKDSTEEVSEDTSEEVTEEPDDEEYTYEEDTSDMFEDDPITTQTPVVITTEAPTMVAPTTQTTAPATTAAPSTTAVPPITVTPPATTTETK